MTARHTATSHTPPFFLRSVNSNIPLIVSGPHFHLNLTPFLDLCSCVARLKGGYRALQVTAFLFVPPLLTCANFIVAGSHDFQDNLNSQVTQN